MSPMFYKPFPSLRRHQTFPYHSLYFSSLGPFFFLFFFSFFSKVLHSFQPHFSNRPIALSLLLIPSLSGRHALPPSPTPDVHTVVAFHRVGRRRTKTDQRNRHWLLRNALLKQRRLRHEPLLLPEPQRVHGRRHQGDGWTRLRRLWTPFLSRHCLQELRRQRDRGVQDY